MPIPSEMYYYLYIRKKRKEKQGRRIKERQGRGREIKGGEGMEGQVTHWRSLESMRPLQYCRNKLDKIGRISAVSKCHPCAFIQFRFVLFPCVHMLCMINTVHFTSPFV